MTTSDYNKKYYNRPEIKTAHAKYMREFYLAHKKELLVKQSKYYVDNKDKIKEYMKVYMRNYKKKNSLRKNSVNPKSKVIDKVDKDKV